MRSLVIRLFWGLMLAALGNCAQAQFVNGQVLTAQALNTQFALYVPIAGGTLTGPLTVPTLTTMTPISQSSGGTGSTSIAAPGGAFDSLCSSIVGRAWVRLTNGWGCTSLGYANPSWWGAIGNGLANDTAAVESADTAANTAGVQLALEQNYLLSGTVTLNSNILVLSGRLTWVNNSDSVTINGNISANDMAGWLNYPVTSHVVLTQPSHVSVGWLYGPDNGSLDVSRFMNDAIASSPSFGREVFIPIGAWRLKAETVQIGMQNYITIDGASSGERSGIEYFKAPPVGIGGQTEFPGGGSALLVDKSLTLGINLAPYSSTYSTYRVSGLTLKHFHMSGSNNSLVATGGAGPQSGIWLQGANDGTVVDDLSMVSFSGTALEVDNMDAADIGNSWIAEDTNCVYLGVSGIRSRIHDLALGANTSQFNNSYGTALHLTGTTLSTFSNISIFGGAQAIVLDGGSNFNSFSGWRIDNNFTGQIVIVSGSENVFTGGGIYVNPNGTTDPLGRDNLYGVIQLQAGDANQFIGIDQNTQLTAPYDDIRLNGGNNTEIIGGTHWGPTSAEAVHVQSSATVGSVMMLKAASTAETLLDTPLATIDATYKTY